MTRNNKTVVDISVMLTKQQIRAYVAGIETSRPLARDFMLCTCQYWPTCMLKINITAAARYISVYVLMDYTGLMYKIHICSKH